MILTPSILTAAGSSLLAIGKTLWGGLKAAGETSLFLGNSAGYLMRGQAVYLAGSGVQKIGQTIGGGLRFITNKPQNPEQSDSRGNAFPGLSAEQIDAFLDKFGKQQIQLETFRLQGMDELQQKKFLHECKLQKNEIVARRRLQTLQQRFLATESEKTRDFDRQENMLNRLLQLKMQKNQQDSEHVEKDLDRTLQAYMFYVEQINKRWPLILDPMEFVDQNLYFTRYYENGIPNLANISDTVTPLKVIVTPFEALTNFDNDQAAIKMEAATGLMRKHIALNYRLDNPDNPVEILDGAWNSSAVCGGAAIHNIFNIMRRTPTLLQESRQCGDFIELSYAYWNGLSSNYTYQNVIRIDCPKLIESLVRQQTKQLEDKDVQSMDSDIRKPSDADTLSYRNYALTPALRQSLLDVFSYVQQFYTSLFADLHHLYYNIALPVLPQYIDDYYNKLSCIEEQVRSGFPTKAEVCLMYAGVFEQLIEENRKEDTVIIMLYYARTMAHFGEVQGAYKILNLVCDDICDALELGRKTFGSEEEKARENVSRLLSCEKLYQFEDALIPLHECNELLFNEEKR